MRIMIADTGNENELMFMYFTAGLVTGGQFTLVPVLVDEWFGHASFGTIHGTVMLGAILGQVVMANGVAYVFIEACDNNTVSCVRPTFVIGALLCAACVPAVGMGLRSSQEEAMEAEAEEASVPAVQTSERV